MREGVSAMEVTHSILSLLADDTKWGRCGDIQEDRERFQIRGVEQDLANSI